MSESEAYRARALQAERIAERYALADERSMAIAWRRVASSLRATADRLMMRPALVVPS